MNISLIIFSSSTTVYGNPAEMPITENCPKGHCTNPYGRTKSMLEEILIDMNPNYIGWSIVDWKSSSEFEVIESGVYSFKKFSDLYKQLNDLKTVSSDDPRRIKLSNKRTYETIKVAENIISKALYYKC